MLMHDFSDKETSVEREVRRCGTIPRISRPYPWAAPFLLFFSLDHFPFFIFMVKFSMATKRIVKKTSITQVQTPTLLQDLFFRWLPLGFAITMLTGLIYVAVQQNYRQNANDNQIEIISGLVEPLAQGQSPEALNSAQKQDISKTLSPFVMVFNDKGKVVASTADLNGSVPTVPSGMLEAAKAKGQSRVTWQPAPGVREATVINYYKGKSTGYVLVGKSLTEVEKRVNELTKMVFITWLFTMIGSFVLAYLIETASPLVSKKK